MKKALIAILAIAFFSCQKQPLETMIGPAPPPLPITIKPLNFSTRTCIKVCPESWPDDGGGIYDPTCPECPAYEEDGHRYVITDFPNVLPGGGCVEVCIVTVTGGLPFMPVGGTTTPQHGIDRNLDGYDDNTASYTYTMMKYLPTLTETEKQYLLSNPNTTTLIFKVFTDHVLGDTIDKATLVAFREMIKAVVTGRIYEYPNPPDFSELLAGDLNGGLAFLFGNPTDMLVNYRFKLALVKQEHPDWNIYELRTLAGASLLHNALDGAGLVPVLGEVFDLTSGLLYALEGDKFQAKLSVISAFPIVGWGAAATRVGLKVMTKSVVSSVGKTSLVWVKEANRITFGYRGQLRRVLGITDKRLAHHIIPVQQSYHPLVQAAANDSKIPFHMNEFLNGIPLDPVVHRGAHIRYNETLRLRMNTLLIQYPNPTPGKARELLDGLIKQVKTWVTTHPGINIDNIIF